MTARRKQGKKSVATLLAIFAGSALSLNALAANDTVCDSVSGAELKVPVPEITLRAVDYPADTSAEITESLDLSGLDTEEIPALISLTPRVASVIDQMFAGQADTDEEMAEPIPEAPASPVAESVPAQPGLQLPIAAPIGDTDEEELQVPGLQDQMYRKDI